MGFFDLCRLRTVEMNAPPYTNASLVSRSHSERVPPAEKTLKAPKMRFFRFAMAADSRDERTADYKRAFSP